MRNDSPGRPTQQVVTPSILRERDRWLRWELKTNAKGKATKVPDRSTRHAERWLTHAAASAGEITNTCGVGFVFTGGVDTEAGRVYALDVDGCRDPVSGAVEPWAMAVVHHYGRTFTEITPSGCGLRVWVIVRDYPKTLARAKVKLEHARPANVPEHKPVEVQLFGYGVPQYVTVTGRLLPGCGTEIETIASLDYLVETFGFAESDQELTSNALPKGSGSPPSVDTIAASIRNSPDAALIVEADWAGAKLGEDPSASGAYWRVAQEALRAAHGHGDAALDFLLTRTAWGLGDVEESADPAKYGRRSWVAAELRRAASKTQATTPEAIFGGGHELDAEAFEPPPTQPLAGTEAARRASPMLTVGKGERRPWFEHTPPAREYLLKHPDGDGLLPRGKVGLFSAAGGTGKTTALVQLAVSIATRSPWLDHFDIGETAGRDVLLLLGEEDEDEVWRKVFYTCAELGLTLEQKREVERHVIAAPLAGEAVPLMRMGEHGNAEGTEHSDALLARLHEGRDWGLVVVDPVSRFAGINVESDNTIATRFVQELERLCHAPGRPTVLAVGHTSKEARRTGTADQRGVTGLFDAVRWAATLNGKSKHRVELEVPKNNLGRPSEMVALLRGEQGLLSAETNRQAAERAQDEERERLAAAALKEDQKLAAQEARRSKLVGEVVDAARRNPGASKATLVALVKGKRTYAHDAVDRAVGLGLLLRESDGKSFKHYVAGLLK